MLGRQEEAQAAVGRARELTQDHPSVMGLYAYALARAGRREEARRVLEALQAEPARRRVRPFDLALAATGLGERERALAWLEQMVEERHVGVRSLASYPEFDPLRSEPRFAALLAGVGLQDRASSRGRGGAGRPRPREYSPCLLAANEPYSPKLIMGSREGGCSAG